MVKNYEPGERVHADPDETIEQVRERLYIAAHRANRAELNARRLLDSFQTMKRRCSELRRENEELKQKLRFLQETGGDDE